MEKRSFLIAMNMLFVSPLVFAHNENFDGITFKTKNKKDLIDLKNKFNYLLQKLEINHFIKKQEQENLLNYSFKNRFEDPTKIAILLNLKNEKISLPQNKKSIMVASKKEIILGMLNGGRNFVFEDEFANMDSFVDYVNVRQNTIAWASYLEWGWPDGETSYVNEKYWDKNFEIQKGKKFKDGLYDIFMNQKKYAFGCNFAGKIVMTMGLYDYYNRIKKDVKITNLLEERLFRDKDYLLNLDPEYNEVISKNNGEILKVEYGISSKSIVPGDLIYLENTDIKTRDKVGYEGSNAIYLGGNKFNDYYNDHNNSYTFEEKIHEVYQWRNGVFSRSRDADKVREMSDIDRRNIRNTPKNGGILRDYRLNQYMFKVVNNKLLTN